MAKQRDVVLLLTHRADYYTIDRVADALSRRGAHPVRVDTDQYPRELPMTWRLGQTGIGLLVEPGETSLVGEEVRAVWTRRIRPARSGNSVDLRFRDLCISESRAAFRGMLDALGSARWVNDLSRALEAEVKPRQLDVARRNGLRVPDTIVTNDRRQAETFYHEHGGAVVAKLMTSAPSKLSSSHVPVPTTEVCESDLVRLDGLLHSPVLFQERVVKAQELRVVFVAEKVFVGSLNASESRAGQTDWRLANTSECAWERDGIPGEAVAGIHGLMDALGLVFGVVDMIRTPQGEHIFLEVNPAGEWGMFERDLGYPVSEAIADALLV
jgi:glutathione synthase/RimK-type ligase-like ATP-grasp enzyme